MVETHGRVARQRRYKKNEAGSATGREQGNTHVVPADCKSDEPSDYPCHAGGTLAVRFTPSRTP
jgi:hypothetical protein